MDNWQFWPQWVIEFWETPLNPIMYGPISDMPVVDFFMVLAAVLILVRVMTK